MQGGLGEMVGETVRSRGHDIKCRVSSGLTRPREYVNSAEAGRNNKEQSANPTLFQITHHLILTVMVLDLLQLRLLLGNLSVQRCLRKQAGTLFLGLRHCNVSAML